MVCNTSTPVVDVFTCAQIDKNEKPRHIVVAFLRKSQAIVSGFPHHNKDVSAAAALVSHFSRRLAPRARCMYRRAARLRPRPSISFLHPQHLRHTRTRIEEHDPPRHPAASTRNIKTTMMQLQVLFDSGQQKIVYAEAEGDFVEGLLKLLLAPHHELVRFVGPDLGAGYPDDDGNPLTNSNRTSRLPLSTLQERCAFPNTSS